MKPQLLIAGILGLLLIVAPSTSKSQENNSKQEKPNIIIIIPDDLGWHDVGYQGSSIKTPNIDKLAKNGVRFNQHYVMPTCTPTRLSLMTGKYPSRYGITGPDYGEVIDLGDPTLPSILAENGYSTSIAGKWHLGSPPYTPLKYGFQTSYGYFDGQIDPYTHEYKTETELTSRKSWHRNDVYLDEEGHATDLITDEAIRVIEANNEKPFFLYVAYSVPHFPLNEPEKWTSVYDDLYLYPSRKWFAASVSHMDDGIGRIIETLEQSGIRENTLVLFISDNGGQKSWQSNTEYRGAYANKPHSVLGNNYPLRGWKGDLYEGGIRVPAFANWPDHLKKGEVNFPIHVSDWLPTLCNLAGVQDLSDHKLDGQNVWPVVVGKQNSVNRASYWKTARDYAVRKGDWKIIVSADSGKIELYNLANDFRETNDLSNENPEKVKELKILLEDFKKNDRTLE